MKLFTIPMAVVLPLVMLISTADAANLVPEKISCVIQDRQAFQSPEHVKLGGWLGIRIDANEANRLAAVDTDRLLEGYRKRPGRQAWDGEHVGKWLHAATLAWVNSGDAKLKQKLDDTVTELIKCQLADGYLGTYVEPDRWTDWDVWAHKYNLIGLITYARYSGNLEPLAACRKMADLLERTFGDSDGKRDIISAGHHVGMAPTSVLEPMVLLYRLTGDPRDLRFCEYILRSWEQPNGPKIVSTLLAEKRVDKVANAKAYEMLSCLNGALEYYRTVGGNREILDACLYAWQDIVDNRLYLTGASSHHERFRDDFDLPNVGNIGETCVTTTWIQFNAQLLRLTGEARFAEQLEKVVLNQLLGAQACDGTAWGYYVQMEGTKPYSSSLDGHCCLSSGPRGVALIPTFATSTDADGAVINLYERGQAKLNLQDNGAVTLDTSTEYPSDSEVHIAITTETTKPFAIKLRLPAWSNKTMVKVTGKMITAETVRAIADDDGYLALTRMWKTGDVIDISLSMEPRIVVGDHKNEGKIAVLYGPLVLSADAALLPPGVEQIGMISLENENLSQLAVTPEPAPDAIKTWPAAQVFRIQAVTRKSTASRKAGERIEIRLVPFADAGSSGSQYKVWLPLRTARRDGNVLVEGWEARSRQGNLEGSINDESADSVVVTFDGQKAETDWYSVSLGEPVSIGRVEFAHGRSFHDGGWFDASASKPFVQVQTSENANWVTVGTLDTYPATTPTSNASIENGQTFSVKFEKPMKVTAVRVIGTPACGDAPNQSFSSCAELRAYDQ